MKNRVLVTGASRGIGRAIALALGKSDYHVTINYLRNETSAQECLKEINNSGGEGSLLPFDVSDRAATRIALEEVVEKSGPYWGIVCNVVFSKTRFFVKKEVFFVWIIIIILSYDFFIVFV